MYQKRAFIQPQNWMGQRGLGAWGVQIGPFAAQKKPPISIPFIFPDLTEALISGMSRVTEDIDSEAEGYTGGLDMDLNDDSRVCILDNPLPPYVI